MRLCKQRASMQKKYQARSLIHTHKWSLANLKQLIVHIPSPLKLFYFQFLVHLVKLNTFVGEKLQLCNDAIRRLENIRHPSLERPKTDPIFYNLSTQHILQSAVRLGNNVKLITSHLVSRDSHAVLFTCTHVSERGRTAKTIKGLKHGCPPCSIGGCYRWDFCT